MPRAPLASEVNSSPEIKNEIITWKKAFIKGVYIGLTFLIVQIVIALIIYIIAHTTFVLAVLSSLLFFETAVYFFMAGLAIWFEPSPSWNSIKSGILQKPFEPKPVDLAMRDGFTRIISALVLFIGIDLNNLLINLFP